MERMNLLEGLYPDGTDKDLKSNSNGWTDASLEELTLQFEPDDTAASDIVIKTSSTPQANTLQQQHSTQYTGSMLRDDVTLMPSLLQNRGDVVSQDAMVRTALTTVHAAAAADPEVMSRLNDDDPEKMKERDIAVEVMMGIRPSTKPKLEANAQKDFGAERAYRSQTRVEAIRGCKTFNCLRIANERPADIARFKFPHFFIVGWQKTATTSIHSWLAHHPQVIRIPEKEPEFFSQTCKYNISACPADETVDYLKRVLRQGYYTGHEGLMAAYEASTHYSRNGHLLAPQLRATLPWIKIVASLREPVSRAISMLVHLLDKSVAGGGCLGQGHSMAHCLLTTSHINGDEWGGPTNYSYPLKAWLDNFPKEQLMILQYEDLISSAEREKQVLHNLKEFLDLDVDELEDRGLEMRNSRKGIYEGWKMKKDEYLAIVDLVREDSRLVADMLEEKGLIPSADAWYENWSKVWEGNLSSCDENDDCIIQVT